MDQISPRGENSGQRQKVELDFETVTELRRLRKLEKEHERLKMEHSLLKKPSGSVPNESRHLLLHRTEPGNLADQNDVSFLWR